MVQQTKIRKLIYEKENAEVSVLSYIILIKISNVKLFNLIF